MCLNTARIPSPFACGQSIVVDCPWAGIPSCLVEDPDGEIPYNQQSVQAERTRTRTVPATPAALPVSRPVTQARVVSLSDL
ncbi:hypothetical protein RRG08_065125 [Elysia crispata]|uniref:Uncharacterized protein n=1 Tax=Elysia crispata TaxID=231223 RepID=A0AAE0Z9Q8_9GAST|nr:hypothetical protein RRG08_065125 [Elysia crispata]